MPGTAGTSNYQEFEVEIWKLDTGAWIKDQHTCTTITCTLAENRSYVAKHYPLGSKDQVMTNRTVEAQRP